MRERRYGYAHVRLLRLSLRLSAKDVADLPVTEDVVLRGFLSHRRARRAPGRGGRGRRACEESARGGGRPAADPGRPARRPLKRPLAQRSIERIKLVARAAGAAPAAGFGRSRILVVDLILVREGEEEEVAEELGRVSCGARGEAQLDL